jgi:hypothetical protein
MTMKLRGDLEPLTARLARLPIDARGYPIPWFVAWVDQDGRKVPDFRVVDSAKFVLAVKERRCWVCGVPLGRWLAFPIGPMCAITRTTSEPPCHLECAEWSARNCPFLVNPSRGRDTANLPSEHEQAAGFGLTRNPGVVAVWLTRGYDVFQVREGNRGVLITMGDPAQVTWWREGRRATVEEVETSINGGFPALMELAKLQGPFAVEELGRQYKRAEQLWQPPTYR